MIKIIILAFSIYFNLYADVNASELSSESTNPYIQLIIVGIATLLFFYIKELYNTAVEKKLIAIKLEAYLNNWINEILKNEDLFTLINIGQSRSKELILVLDDEQKWTEIHDKQKKDIKELKVTLIENEAVLTHLKSLHSKFINMPDDLFNLTIENTNDSIEHVYKNTSFISDYEASKISWYTTDSIIKTRHHILNSLGQTKYLYYTLKNMNEFDVNLIRDNYSSIVESIIMIGEQIDRLKDKAKLIRQRNILQNMFSY